ncbi:MULTISPECIES: hypothetical protein [unclassified Streptomyces]|uniref:hypothetical protein n=1 Tax=Streptomycetaceae TaxID=2062 RepID=UPI002E75AC07|nr:MULTISPECIES: hypothetical protein [unclassified Streptomyces]MED7949729.1 hypothetical protein [Streptomyces sp. BE303]MEE1823978.1 hypothetical protein [Streptomyces sp. BE20]
MTYHIDVARATIDDRLREAEKHRLVRALRLKSRAERSARRAHRALTSLAGPTV